MRLLLLFLLFFTQNTFGQIRNSGDILARRGIHQALKLEAFYYQNVGHDIQSQYGKIVAAYYNKDTSKAILITEKISTYDPTNNIREDEHNKVNFITADAFEEHYSNKHVLRTISAIYYSDPNDSNQWFLEVTDSTNYFIEISRETLTNYITRQIRPFFIDKEKQELLPVFWDSGRFAPSPDLRLHPAWNSYGKNIWQNREKKWRPYIGIPVLVRDFYLNKINNHGY